MWWSRRPKHIGTRFTVGTSDLLSVRTIRGHQSRLLLLPCSGRSSVPSEPLFICVWGTHVDFLLLWPPMSRAQQRVQYHGPSRAGRGTVRRYGRSCTGGGTATRPLPHAHIRIALHLRLEDLRVREARPVNPSLQASRDLNLGCQLPLPQPHESADRGHSKKGSEGRCSNHQTAATSLP